MTSTGVKIVAKDIVKTSVLAGATYFLAKSALEQVAAENTVSACLLGGLAIGTAAMSVGTVVDAAKEIAIMKEIESIQLNYEDTDYLEDLNDIDGLDFD